MSVRAVSFEEHQEAKRLSRQRDADDVASGRVSLQELSRINGGIRAFVKRGAIGASRKPLKKKLG